MADVSFCLCGIDDNAGLSFHSCFVLLDGLFKPVERQRQKKKNTNIKMLGRGEKLQETRQGTEAARESSRG